ncbi:alpha/beta-hydrolase [Trametopsis cervina]|nr:alpha/beta-hydrolase [Trametopsis cervina]
MPIIPVNEDGAVLYYEDSGTPLNSKDYHTVFLIHGFIFHSAIFRPLFAHAAAQNLRLISINVREYPGSTPLSDEELARLVSRHPPEEARALAEQGVEIARFVAEMIKLERFPCPSVGEDGKKSGGVSILAWSLGNMYLLSMLGNLAMVDNDANDLLEKYVRSVIIYDPPCPVYGTPEPRGAYITLDDPSVPPERIVHAFIEWVSSYWEPFEDLDAVTEPAVAQQKNMVKLSSDPKVRPSSTRMSQAELEAVVYPPVGARIGHPGHISRDVVAVNARRSLFDTGGAWKHVKAVVLWGDMSCAYCPWGAKVLSEQLLVPPQDGEIRRDIEIVQLKKANHFLHYDEPERFVQLMTEWTR